MSSPSTKETVNLLDRAEFLGTAIRTQLPTVSPVLTETYGPLPPSGDGEPSRETSWDDVQLQNAALVGQAVAEVQETSKAHRVAKIAVSEFVSSRQGAAVGLQRRHRAHQKTVGGSCGPRGLALVGLDVPPVSTILGMREQSSLVLRQYENPSTQEKLAELPKSEAPGPVPDLVILSGDLKGDIEIFEVAQSGLNQAKKVRDEAYVARQEARLRLRRIVANVARVQEGYYRLAGLDELADRLRLTVPRSRKRKAASEPPPAGSAAEATESSDESSAAVEAEPSHES